MKDHKKKNLVKDPCLKLKKLKNQIEDHIRNKEIKGIEVIEIEKIQGNMILKMIEIVDISLIKEIIQGTIKTIEDMNQEVDLDLGLGPEE